MLDENNQTAIVSVRGEEYYKIPGGVVESGENIQDVLSEGKPRKR